MKAFSFIALLLIPSVVMADPEVATVQIVIDGSHGSGSGAVVSVKDGESLVLTNKHVASVSGYKYGIRSAGKWYPAEFIRSSLPCDLALLRVKATLVSVPLASTEPKPGSAVRIFGYGGPPRTGTVIGANGDRFVGKGESWALELNPDNGSSGSPVVDAQGNLCGLIWGKDQFQQGQAVRLHEVKAFLDGKDIATAPITSEVPRSFPAPTQTFRTVPGFTGSGRSYAPAQYYYLQPTCPNGNCPAQSKNR